MSEPANLYLRVLWIGAALFVAGIALDQRWHATHDEFEGTAQQFEAHWLLWLGFPVVLVATLLAFTRLHARERHPGFGVVIGASAVYLPVTVWHFVAHANEVDPDVAYVLLAVGDAALVAGAGWTVIGWIRTRSGSSRTA